MVQLTMFFGYWLVGSEGTTSGKNGRGGLNPVNTPVVEAT